MLNNKSTKVKMTNAHFDPKTGVSTVTITSPYGTFTGIAKLHPDDAQYASEFAGCECAEMRANIKYMKARLKEVEIQLDIMIKYFKTINGMKNNNPLGIEFRKAKRFIYELNRERKMWKNNIASAEEHIRMKIKLRDETHKKLADRSN